MKTYSESRRTYLYALGNRPVWASLELCDHCLTIRGLHKGKHSADIRRYLRCP